MSVMKVILTTQKILYDEILTAMWHLASYQKHWFQTIIWL